MMNRMYGIGVCAALMLAFVGCTSFDVLATRRYVDEDNNYVTVEEGRDEKEREFIIPQASGRPFVDKTKEKIRLTLPDGRRFVMYRRLSPIGNLFKTDDEVWEFFVLGVQCRVCRRPEGSEKYALSYQGTLCATESNPLNEKRNRSLHRFSSPSNFKSPTTSGDSSKPKGNW